MFLSTNSITYCRTVFRNILRMSAMERVKQNADMAKGIIDDLKSELSSLNRTYNDLLAETLRAENTRLLAMVEEANKNLVKLEIENGIKQIAVPNNSTSQQTKTSSDEARTHQQGRTSDKKASEQNQQQQQTNDIKKDTTGKPKDDNKKKAKNKPSSSVPVEQQLPVDVGRLDLRIAKIVDVQRHPDADTLYVLKIDCGETDRPARTVCSGLVNHVPIEELRDRQVMLLCNLKPVKMRGIISEAMVMCASSEQGVEVLIPPPGCAPGDLVHCDGYTRQPDSIMNPKQKIFEKVSPDLHTDASLNACYKNVPLYVPDKGPVKAKVMKNVPVK